MPPRDHHPRYLGRVYFAPDNQVLRRSNYIENATSSANRNLAFKSLYIRVTVPTWIDRAASLGAPTQQGPVTYAPRSN